MIRPLTITPVLGLKLPLLPNGQLYQLAYVDLCRLAPKSTFQKQVAVFFLVKCPKDKYMLPIGEPIRRWVHLAQASVLVPSSLWDAQPDRITMVSDGRFYPATATHEPDGEPIWAAKKQLSLGNSQNYTQRINEVFPNSAAFKSSFLRSRGDSWVVVRKQEDITYILPCFELLRAFYYIGTPHLIEFFFSLAPLDTLCQVIQAPSVDNGHTARIMVVADGFSQHQLCVLAELCLNDAYRKSIEKMHNLFFPTALRKKAGAAVKLDFQLSRNVELEVTGFTFNYEQKPHFWVCGIRRQSAYWSFQELDYTTAIDHRVGPISSGTEPSLTPLLGPPAFRAAASKDSPIMDSEQAGHSLSQVAVQLDLALYTDLPVVTVLPKQEQEHHQPTQRQYFSVVPEYLSTEGGGKNLRTLRITRLTLGQKIPLPKFFESVTTQLAKLHDFSVTILQLNNEQSRFGDGLSVHPAWLKQDSPELSNEPHRVAIAHIQHSGGHFYFFQFLRGGRAALVYYQQARQMTIRDLNNLLDYLTKNRFNWQAVFVLYRKEHPVDNQDTVKDEVAKRNRRFQKMMGPGLIIIPRNHNSKGDYMFSAAVLCEQQIRSAVTQ